MDPGERSDRDALLRELKAARGEELRRRTGAHSLGIGRKRVAGRATGELALVFYLDPAVVAQGANEPVPETIAFQPASGGPPVELPTDVVEMPQPRFEGPGPQAGGVG